MVGSHDWSMRLMVLNGVRCPSPGTYFYKSGHLVFSIKLSCELWANPCAYRIDWMSMQVCGWGQGAALLRWGEKAAGITPKSYHNCLKEAPFNKLWNWLFVSWYPEIPFAETLLVNRRGSFSILPNPKTVDLQIHFKSYIISYGFSDGIL